MAEAAAVQTPVQSIVDSLAPAAPAVADPSAPKTEKVSQSLQILVQREKKALERERAAKLREQEVEAKFQTLAEREAKMKEFDEMLETKPLEALEKRGMPYKKLTEIAMNDGAIPIDHELKKLKDEFDAYRKSQEDGTRQKAEDEKQRAVQSEAKVIEDFKGDILKMLDAEPKKYELTLFDGAQGMVYDVIDEHYNRTLNEETGVGEIMDKATAADKVEKWLRETKYAKATDLEFFKSLLPQQLKPEVKQESTFRPPQHRTLTNQLSATPSKPRTGVITDEQRIAKAIAYAKGLRP